MVSFNTCEHWITTEPENAAVAAPRSQDKWVLRKEGVIWSSKQEMPEEMVRKVRSYNKKYR